MVSKKCSVGGNRSWILCMCGCVCKWNRTFMKQCLALQHMIFLFLYFLFCSILMALEKCYSWSILQFEKHLYSVSNPCIKCIKDKLEIGKTPIFPLKLPNITMEILFLFHFLLALRIQTLFCRHWETLKDSKPACVIIRLIFSTCRIAFKQEGWFPGVGGCWGRAVAVVGGGDGRWGRRWVSGQGWWVLFFYTLFTRFSAVHLLVFKK